MAKLIRGSVFRPVVTRAAKDGKRRKPSEIGWRVQGERTGEFGFEGSPYLYNAFFVGPHPPDSDFDRSNVLKAMQEQRASSDQ